MIIGELGKVCANPKGAGEGVCQSEVSWGGCVPIIGELAKRCVHDHRGAGEGVCQS